MKYLKFTISAVLLTISIAAASAQIAAVENFLAENPKLDKYFVYQSTLRMLNSENDPAFNKLIKNLKKINAYVAPGSSEVSTHSYQKMLTELQNDKFETLVSAKQQGVKLNLLMRDKGNNSYYVLAAHDEDSFALLEMDGSLNLEYLSSIEGVNFTQLREIVMGDEKKDRD